MSFVNRRMAVDFDMDFDKQRGATFSDPAFLDGPDARNASSDRTDLLFDFLRRSRIEDIARGDVQESQSAVGDHRAGDQGGPIVGWFIPRASNQSDRDSDECCDARNRIGTMMPSIGLQGNTVGLLSYAIGPSSEGFLDSND